MYRERFDELLDTIPIKKSESLEVTLYTITVTSALAIDVASFFAIKSKKDITESATLVVTPKSYYANCFSTLTIQPNLSSIFPVLMAFNVSFTSKPTGLSSDT